MRLLLAFLLVFAPLGTALAQADGRITFLSRQLTKSSDARVRSQAALMLGATKNSAAVQPLCTGLDDQSALVRNAAAKAFLQLEEPSAYDCLTRHKSDSDPEVRAAVGRALESLEAQRNRRPEFYIQMRPVQDKNSRLGSELVQLTESHLRAKLEKMGSVFAPDRESKSAAKSVIKSKRLKGYSLKVELEETSSGGLKMNVVCFTYPEQSLLGQVQVKASGAKAADLIRALAPKAIDEAASTFDWSM
ncbi:MAG: HEAT repeat domain-containing protein [Myxococcota bacterium]|nr:HEAT repeat domain-containing protein [Myxococcota bacterium]